jgi:hypothetical protein
MLVSASSFPMAARPSVWTDSSITNLSLHRWAFAATGALTWLDPKIGWDVIRTQCQSGVDIAESPDAAPNFVGL